MVQWRNFKCNNISVLACWYSVLWYWKNGHILPPLVCLTGGWQIQYRWIWIFLNSLQGKLPYSRKVWRQESLAALVNRLWFAKLKPSKLVLTINSLLADLLFCQTFFCIMLERVNLPNFTPASLSRYAVYVMRKFSLQLVECVNHLLTHFLLQRSPIFQWDQWQSIGN